MQNLLQSLIREIIMHKQIKKFNLSTYNSLYLNTYMNVSVLFTTKSVSTDSDTKTKPLIVY